MHWLRRVRYPVSHQGMGAQREEVLPADPSWAARGRKNPRLGEDFIKWADEESILKIITNTYDYVREYIDKDAPGG